MDFKHAAKIAAACCAFLVAPAMVAAQANMPPPANACGFFLGGGIFTKWRETGGERGFLQCATGSEREAGRSPQGTVGKWAPFRDGLIVWHGNGRRSGQNFVIHGLIASTYQRGGGTMSALGFPVSDEYDVPGGRRSDFEGGSIVWARATGAVQVLAAGAPTPVLPGVTAGGTAGGTGGTAGVMLGAKQLALTGIIKTDPYLNVKRAVVIDDMRAGTMGGYAIVRAVDDGGCSPGRGTPDPGVSQRFRYTWRFDRDVTRVAVGQSVIVTFTLEGDQQKCLNQNPFMTVLTESNFFKSKQSGERNYFNPAAVSPGFHVGGARRIDIFESGMDGGNFVVVLTGLTGNRGMELLFRYEYNVVK